MRFRFPVFPLPSGPTGPTADFEASGHKVLYSDRCCRRIGALAAFCSLLLMGSAALGQVVTVTGRVIGQSGESKAFVRVDIKGPQTTTILTDRQGTFRLTLPVGQYGVRVTDKNRIMQFPLTVRHNDGSAPTIFRVPW